MRHKYYYYKKPNTGIYYCTPLSKTTGKKLYAISTGTKDLYEAKRIMESWASQDKYPTPYQRKRLQHVGTIDALTHLSSMITKKEIPEKDLTALVYQFAQKYKDELTKDLKSFLTKLFTMLDLQADIEGIVAQNDPNKSDINFIDYLFNFWNYKTSPYIRDLIETGTPPSQLPKEDRYFCSTNVLKKYIYWFDKDITLSNITAKKINQFFAHLLNDCNVSEGYMPTLSKIITQPLHFAEKKHIITKNITDDIRKYKDKPADKEILTIEETQKLFSSINNFKNLKHYCINRMAVETASRIGELLALTTSDIKITKNKTTGENECFITINKSYNSRTHKIGSTKTKEVKNIAISAQLLSMLQTLIAKNPYKDILSPFLFFNEAKKDQPVAYEEIIRGFKKAITRLGFARKHLTFHSYRHLAVVILRDNNATSQQIMSITGHKTESTLHRYASHETEKQQVIKKALLEIIVDKSLRRPMN